MDLQEGIVIDSDLTIEEALKQNLERPAPKNILKRQRLLDVLYYGFDGRVHKGQIVVDRDLVNDIKGAFDLILKEKFPIKAVIPSADKRYKWDDDYRYIAKTKKKLITIGKSSQLILWQSNAVG